LIVAGKSVCQVAQGFFLGLGELEQRQRGKWNGMDGEARHPYLLMDAVRNKNNISAT
jgi:hypothetical protein